jgi:hypothetical protein
LEIAMKEEKVTTKSPARKRPAVKPNPGPTDEPGQQPTPDSDALAEVEAVAAGVTTALDQVAAILQSAGAFNQGGALFRDSFDTDVGFHESLRISLANRMASLSALGIVSDTVLASKQLDISAVAHTKAQDAQTLANFENNSNSFFGMLTRSNSTAQSALTQAYSLETDNEVLTTAQLSEMVKMLNGKMNTIVDVIEGAAPKTE